MRNPWYKVPALKAQLKMPDEKYRAILKSFGIASSKDITDYEMTNAICDAMLGKKPTAPKKFTFKFETKKPRHAPWKIMDATPEMWADLGNVISQAYDRGVTCVAVSDSFGKQYFKYRELI
jgi:hypothetical protein